MNESLKKGVEYVENVLRMLNDECAIDVIKSLTDEIMELERTIEVLMKKE